MKCICQLLIHSTPPLLVALLSIISEIKECTLREVGGGITNDRWFAGFTCHRYRSGTKLYSRTLKVSETVERCLKEKRDREKKILLFSLKRKKNTCSFTSSFQEE